MAFSIIIVGGIAGIIMIMIFSIVFSMTKQVYEINSSRTQSTDLQNTVLHTNLEIKNIMTSSNNQYVNFTLKNIGNEKLWNYEKFDLIINYTANISEIPTQRIEYLSYTTESSCGQDGTFTTNKWTILNIAQDYVDPDIINTNELALVCTKLTYPIYTNGLVEVTISTDVGYTKTSYTTIP